MTFKKNWTNFMGVFPNVFFPNILSMYYIVKLLCDYGRPRAAMPYLQNNKKVLQTGLTDTFPRMPLFIYLDCHMAWQT